MLLIVYYLVFMLGGSLSAYLIGLIVERAFGSYPKQFLKTLSPMGTISDAKDIAEAVVYLTEARHVTGEVLHVDGGAHVGKW